MIRALITDFGGVLVRTVDDTARRALETRLGLPPHTIEDRIFNGEASLRGQRGEIGYDEVWRLTCNALSPNRPMSAGDLRKAFFGGDVLDHDLMAFIRSVRPAIKTGLISNAWSNARRLFTQTYPVADAFDVMVISAEEKIMKPDPRIYRIALERLEVGGAESIFVDDVLENVRGAEALGMHGIRFHSTEQVRREVERLIKRET